METDFEGKPRIRVIGNWKVISFRVNQITIIIESEVWLVLYRLKLNSKTVKMLD